MKHYLILAMTICCQTTVAQINPEEQPVSVSIICFNNSITKDKGSQFIFKIVNNTDSLLKLPKHLKIGYYYDQVTHLGVEITEAFGDTSKRIRVIPDLQLNPLPSDRGKYNYLQKGNEILVQESFPEMLFGRNGVYRVRFVFHAEKFSKKSKPVRTNWVIVNVVDFFDE